MSAVTDLTAAVADVATSVDAAVALLQSKGADDPAVVKAVTDIKAAQAKLDAQVAKG